MRQLVGLALIACAFAIDEDPKAEKKACSSSLKGDFAFEACGAFCKEAKKGNHCKCVSQHRAWPVSGAPH